MQLTRRDALIAAATAGALGVGGVAGAELRARRSVEGRETLTHGDIDTLVALAEVVYPSAVEGVAGFVETYATAVHVERRRAMTAAIDDLNRAVRRTHGRDFAAFDHDRREALLREMGVHRVVADSTGSTPARVRSYLVNGLLYALFTTPAGSSLVGLDNPLGYPGGYASALGVDR